MSSLITQNLSQLSIPQVIDNYITVKTASELTGYNNQYLRRLLRAGTLEGIKISQIGLIEIQSLEMYLQTMETTSDQR